MQAILLAGGLGTRLRSVVDDRPKPMALIGERPFLEYVVHELEKQGIRDIIFAVGYKGTMVEEHFKDGSGFGIRATYAYEPFPLGTGGAVKNAGEMVTEDRVLVLNADTLYQVDYGKLARIYDEDELDMALVLRTVPDVSRYGRAILEDGYLVAFDEKADKPEAGTINGGVYLMSTELLEEIPQGRVSLEHEMIPRWLRGGVALGGMVHDGYFIDIGVPTDYYLFNRDVKKGVITW